MTKRLEEAGATLGVQVLDDIVVARGGEVSVREFLDIRAAQKGNKSMARKQRLSSRACNWETVREIALELPEVEEGTSYGTPAFKVRGKLFVRLKEDSESIVIRIDEADRALRLQGDPSAFYLTDHYVNYPWILVRLSAVAQDDLADLLRDAWRLRAPARLAAQYDGEKSEPAKTLGQSRRSRRRSK